MFLWCQPISVFLKSYSQDEASLVHSGLKSKSNLKNAKHLLLFLVFYHCKLNTIWGLDCPTQQSIWRHWTLWKYNGLIEKVSVRLLMIIVKLNYSVLLKWVSTSLLTSVYLDLCRYSMCMQSLGVLVQSPQWKFLYARRITAVRVRLYLMCKYSFLTFRLPWSEKLCRR